MPSSSRVTSKDSTAEKITKSKPEELKQQGVKVTTGVAKSNAGNSNPK
jgi:hypothetical protein